MQQHLLWTVRLYGKGKEGKPYCALPPFPPLSYVRDSKTLFSKKQYVFPISSSESHPFFSKLGSFAEVFPRSIWHRHPFFQKMYKKGAYDVLDTVDLFSLSCANLVFCFLKKNNASGCCAAGIVRPKGGNKTLLPPPLLPFPFHARSDSLREEFHRIAFINMHKAKKNSWTVRGKQYLYRHFETFLNHIWNGPWFMKLRLTGKGGGGRKIRK